MRSTTLLYFHFVDMASSCLSTRHILLTGPPGVGKTTLIKKIVESLNKHGVKASGFYTEEVRQRGQRTGFDVVTLDGNRGPLATVQASDIPQGRQYTVGKYSVTLTSFENVALPTLRLGPKTQTEKKSNIFVIDEIGKMEIFSQSFVSMVKQVLDNADSTVIATIPVAKGRPIQFVEEVRRRKDVTLFAVSRENRDTILEDILAVVQQFIQV